MQLIYLNRKTNITKYKSKEVLNLCIYGTLEKYFNFNLLEYFNLIKPIKSLKFKDNYLDKIDKIAFNLARNNSANNSKLAQVLSYRTFSKLAVSDNLVDKFWVIEQLNLYKDSELIVFIDDLDIYNLYSSKNTKTRIGSIVPYKQIFYFFIFLFNKIRASRYIFKPNFKNNFKLFVGHKFEVNKNNGGIYEEYFFSKFWKNQSNSFLLLDIGDWNPKIEMEQEILFKDSFLTFYDLFDLFFVSLKHFYNPIQFLGDSYEDRIINRNLIQDIKSASFIDSYRNFYIYTNLLKFLNEKKGKLIIPHEGRTYERIICSVFERTKIDIIGYAHFPVSERILNYFYGEFESLIYNNFYFYTLSEINYKQFIDFYKWPSYKVGIGAHLKAKPYKLISANKKSFDILILLGNELNQNIKLLTFIRHSLLNNNLKVLVRLHPSSRGVHYLEKLFLKFNFYRLHGNSLIDDVKISKIIVYGDTGAAVDCLNFNLPLCYINDDNCLLSDRINDIVNGHYRFFDIYEFRRALPDILKRDINISYKCILQNYISPLNPKSFTFE
jgi:hypothetical protein